VTKLHEDKFYRSTSTFVGGKENAAGKEHSHKPSSYLQKSVIKAPEGGTMTPKYLIIMLTLGLLGGGTALSASAQESDGMTPGAAIIEAAPQTGSPAVTPNVVVPASSKAEPADAGIRAHTNFVIHNPKGIQPHTLTDLSQAEPEDNPTPNATYAEYPASLVYLQNGPSLCWLCADE
jgi:hypothetical protein